MKELIHVQAGRDGWAILRRPPARPHPEHRHDAFELNLVARGTCTYLIDGRRVRMQRDHLIALFPAQDHVLIEESPDHQMWIAVWTPACVARLLRGPRAGWAAARPVGEALWRLGVRHARTLAALAESVTQLEDHQAANAALTALLIGAWEFARAAPAGATSVVHPSIAAAARRLRADPTLDGAALARAVGLSRARLSRRFHAEVGVPLAAFRTRVRLERARDLLAQGRFNLLQAALAAGFGSYAQFHRVVRAQLGVSPRDLVD